jgi:hypothetical protein
MKSTIFWDITPYSLLKVSQCRVLLATCFRIEILLASFIEPDDGGNVSPKSWLIFNYLHDVTSQKEVFFNLIHNYSAMLKLSIISSNKANIKRLMFSKNLIIFRQLSLPEYVYLFCSENDILNVWHPYLMSLCFQT